MARDDHASDDTRPDGRAAKQPRGDTWGDTDRKGEYKGMRRAAMSPRRLIRHAQTEADDIGVRQERQAGPEHDRRNRWPLGRRRAVDPRCGGADGDVTEAGHGMGQGSEVRDQNLPPASANSATRNAIATPGS